MLDLAKYAWEQQHSLNQSVIECMKEMHDESLASDVGKHAPGSAGPSLGLQQEGPSPGALVLVLISTSDCKFLAKWQGLYAIIE